MTRQPYGTVVVPAHDRHLTLPIAIESIRTQTVDNIEILIAGDGATDAVRQASMALAAADPRIRFLDQPKAPLRGGANRDRAVRAARSTRIFYCDDDDILLPDHVETLGPFLDQADIVDTPTLTIDTEGGIHRGTHDSSLPLFKRLLVEERFKGVFDTHLAHRKQAYLRMADVWGAAPDHRVVLHLLKTFAQADDIRWLTIDRITALSLHGVRRVAMNQPRRAAELRHWARFALHKDAEQRLRDAAGYCQHFQRLAEALKAAPSSDESVNWSTLGAGSVDAGFLPAEGSRPMRRLRALIDLNAGTSQRHATEDLLGSLQERLEPLLGPMLPGPGVLQPYLTALGSELLGKALDALPDRPATVLARLHLCLLNGDSDVNVSKLDQALANADETNRFFFGSAAMKSLHQIGLCDQALRWCDELVELAPNSRTTVDFWKHRACWMRQASRMADAAHAQQQSARLSTSVV